MFKVFICWVKLTRLNTTSYVNWKRVYFNSICKLETLETLSQYYTCIIGTRYTQKWSKSQTIG